MMMMCGQYFLTNSNNWPVNEWDDDIKMNAKIGLLWQTTLFAYACNGMSSAGGVAPKYKRGMQTDTRKYLVQIQYTLTKSL